MSYDPSTSNKVTTPSAQVDPADDRLAGNDVLQILWRGRVPLIAITVGIGLAVTAAAFSIPAEYEAKVVMMAVPESESEDRLDGIGSAVSQIGGGLASLAGLSGADSTLKTEGMAVLQSEALTERYIRENNLLPILYWRKWDPVRMQWKTSDPERVPTIWKANRFFKDLRTVNDNLKTNLITLTIEWRDPKQAAKWANDLVAMTNEYLRAKAVDEAERDIAFLEAQEGKSNLLSLQEAAASLTETQLRKVMLARGRTEYALKVMDPATVPEKKSFPQPAIWIPAGFFGGLFLAILFVMLRAGSPATTRSSGSTAGAKESV